MARGVNKAIVLGFLGDDPSVRYTQSGNAVANISVATTEKWKDKNSGEDLEKDVSAHESQPEDLRAREWPE